MRGKSNNRFKLTAKEKGWILYDVGNSAFVLMVSTILPIYFNYLAENAGISSVDYLAYWGKIRRSRGIPPSCRRSNKQGG